jgi:peptidoglycan hydrolase-like protein with peptidoglycan-binding domain
MSDTIDPQEDTLPGGDSGLNLVVGSTGYGVILVQQQLNVVTDGLYTDETRASVEAMQTAQGIPVTGECDQLTLSYLGLHWPPGASS